jgi:hypothetical protein
MSLRGTVPWIIGLIVLAIIFQLFLRYQYVQGGPAHVRRIDRLTGTSRFSPCLPPIYARPPSPRDLRLDDHRAIQLVKNYVGATFSTPAFGMYNLSTYRWLILGRYPGSCVEGPSQNVLDEIVNGRSYRLPAGYSVRLVCYCSPKRDGWRYQVYLDTGQVLYIED